jgi:SAM-dependent methyltransferase
MGFDVTGIDISENAINKARKLNDSVKFVQDDILNSHIHQQFDFIFDRGCFHIIDEDKRSIYRTEVVKLLNKNGMLFLKCFSDKNTFTGFGPHLISEKIIESLFQEPFNILQIKDSVYQSNSSQQKKTLFVVMKKED